MKKFLLIFMVLSFAMSTSFAQFAGYDKSKDKVSSPRIQLTGFEDISTPDGSFMPAKGGFSLSLKEANIGFTAYDWNTNQGPKNQVIVWEDGWVSACYTQAIDLGYGDRGTGYAYYDGNVWHESLSRVEQVRTGFGCLARYGQQGVVICAHTADGIMISICDDRQGTSWRYANIPVSVNNMGWPSVMTSGPNRTIIHVLAGSSSATYQGLTSPLLYYRSLDGGVTWDKIDELIPYFTSQNFKGLGSNTYCFMETTASNRLSFVVCDAWTDGVVTYSDNNGDSWEQVVFYQHPDKMAATLAPGTTWMLYPRWATAAWDKNNMLHVAFEFNGDSGEGGHFYPGIGGVAYWNDNMPVMDSTYVSEELWQKCWFYSDSRGPMPANYMGYLVPFDASQNVITNPYAPSWPNINNNLILPEQLGEHGSYNCGIVGMPTIAMDANDNIYITYISLASGFETGTQTYFRIFSRASKDQGETWTDIELLTKGYMHTFNEDVYPCMNSVVRNNKLHVTYQQDGAPGTVVIGGSDTDPSDNYWYAITVDIDPDFSELGINKYVAESIDMKVYPNPATDFTSIYSDKKANITIYNSLGQAVKSFKHAGGYMDVEVSSLHSGIYVVVAQSGNATKSSKLVVK